MNDLFEKYDAWLDDRGPAALVVREHLMPVEGLDGVLFPATFAASEDKTFKGGYNVDTFADGKNICLIDSVGSQANRIEPLFARHKYAGLVPQGPHYCWYEASQPARCCASRWGCHCSLF